MSTCAHFAKNNYTFAKDLTFYSSQKSKYQFFFFFFLALTGPRKAATMTRTPTVTDRISLVLWKRRNTRPSEAFSRPTFATSSCQSLWSLHRHNHKTVNILVPRLHVLTCQRARNCYFSHICINDSVIICIEVLSIIIIIMSTNVILITCIKCH